MELNEAQVYLAQILARHEVVGEIDRCAPGKAGLLLCLEARYSEETRQMLADYEELKRAIRAEIQQLLSGFAWANAEHGQGHNGRSV